MALDYIKTIVRARILGLFGHVVRIDHEIMQDPTEMIITRVLHGVVILVVHAPPDSIKFTMIVDSHYRTHAPLLLCLRPDLCRPKWMDGSC